MPSYTFLNTQTDEYEDHIIPYDDLKDFEKKNPNLKRQLAAPKFQYGNSPSHGKLDHGWRDHLKEMKKKHPRSKGLDHLL